MGLLGQTDWWLVVSWVDYVALLATLSLLKSYKCRDDDMATHP